MPRYCITKHCQKRQQTLLPDGTTKWTGNRSFNVHLCIGETAKKADAITISKACPYHSQVFDNTLLKRVFDNGLDPEPLSAQEYLKAGGV